ncbi:anthranilate synthase component I family protein [Streptomyces sp. NPDC005271]|uniref:anthranilate synthase component I family protein n=1 Tax=unclassified Streptomyces TaxID=2593676 RepID=UPI0033A7253F
MSVSTAQSELHPEARKEPEPQSAAPAAEPIGVRVTSAELPAHAPLDLCLRLREQLGAEEVFLTESPVAPEQDRRPAVVGCGRLAELRVYAGHVEIEGLSAVRAGLTAAADQAGMVPGSADPDTAAADLDTADTGTVGVTVRRAFRTSAQLWDLLGRARHLFALDTDLPETAYAFGFLVTFAYEAAWHMEDLPPRAADPATPDITLTLFRDTVWYVPAHESAPRLLTAAGPGFPEGGTSPVPPLAALAGSAALCAGAGAAPDAPPPLSVHDSVDRDTFLAWAKRCLEHIRVGDIYQIQIGHRIDVRTELTPVDVYRRLRGRNPSPYMFLLPWAGRTLIGASPELFFRIEGDRIVMRPIAGTTRRGPDRDENERRIAEMVASRKERAEHIMLVDLCRNDIGRISLPGTLPVDRLMSVETFSHVFHLVSTVTGRLDPAADVWAATRAAFPAGTMSGAPKLRAMEIIHELEEEPRGAYAGAVGLLDVRGWSELALCIRTIVHQGDTYATQSSAGVVADSVPEAEWAETLAKMGAAYWALTGEELS